MVASTSPTTRVCTSRAAAVSEHVRWQLAGNPIRAEERGDVIVVQDVGGLGQLNRVLQLVRDDPGELFPRPPQ